MRWNKEGFQTADLDGVVPAADQHLPVIAATHSQPRWAAKEQHQQHLKGETTSFPEGVDKHYF